MRKFKLIKKYPGCSYALGEIADHDLTNYSYYENFPENWQEVVEQEYEILKIEKYISPVNKILSIKRLSDGEIFSVGDKIVWDWKSCDNNFFTIQRLSIESNDLQISVEETSNNHPFKLFKDYNLRKYIKKEPFLIAEDGVEVQENAMTYWAIASNSSLKCATVIEYKDTGDYKLSESMRKLAVSDHPEWYKVFSTEKARQEWLDKMYPKPILITEDGVEITNVLSAVFCLNKDNYYTWESLPKYLPKNALVFSTEKARENWLIENKPLFSIKELIEICDKWMGVPNMFSSTKVQDEFDKRAKEKFNIK